MKLFVEIEYEPDEGETFEETKRIVYGNIKSHLGCNILSIRNEGVKEEMSTEPFEHYIKMQETYKWNDDVLEIQQKLVQEIEKKRMEIIVDHFQIDLSEFREFIEAKKRKMEGEQNDRRSEN